MRKYDKVPPDAVAMTESLRAFGYDLATAVADIIDNSLSADSKQIHINFCWSGPRSWVSISDDGKGMTAKELINAMKLGSKDPREERDKQDLGRFGLGLKTASFSQCRRLTVFSKGHDQKENVRCWDLDYLEEIGDWALIDGAYDKESSNKLPQIEDRGTVVLWEKLDRIVGEQETEDEDAHRNFLSRIDMVKSHLSMVFHRFLTGRGEVQIYVNDNIVEPWDPFLEGHSATQLLNYESYGQVKIQPFVLPHQSKLEPVEHQKAGGTKGWNAHQGFYIYRNKRLLVPGGWMRLFKQEEHCKLARVRVDLPNDMDAYWKIDVRKAQAFSPDDLRPEMKRIASATRAKASKVYRHRGAITARRIASEFSVLWLEKQARGKIFYRLNKKHPLFREVSELGGSVLKHFLRLVEETVPVNAIIARFSENTKQFQKPFEDQYRELDFLLQVFIRTFLAEGQSEKEIEERLHRTEPFTDHHDYLAAKDLRKSIIEIRDESN